MIVTDGKASVHLPAHGYAIFTWETQHKMNDLIWGNLLHISFNMWPDRNAPNLPHEWKLHEHMYFDDVLWEEVTREMAVIGMNMVVLDLGDAIQYESHPEISLPDAWNHDQLKRELARLRGLGLEPIPKLNFSTGHDAWMKEYSRMVSTRKYYEVCANLIAEVSALFDSPRFFIWAWMRKPQPTRRTSTSRSFVSTSCIGTTSNFWWTK